MKKIKVAHFMAHSLENAFVHCYPCLYASDSLVTYSAKEICFD